MKNISASVLLLLLISSLIFTDKIQAETFENEDKDEQYEVHIVEHNETLEGIASNYDVSTSQLLEWNDLDTETLSEGQELMILEPGYYSRGERTHTALDKVLEKYEDYPVYIYVETLNSESQVSSLNGTSYVYGASVPKIVLAAFVLDKVSNGTLDWDDTFTYSEQIYNGTEVYAWGGSGIMQYGDYRNGDYTLRELTEMTLKNSDNMASNMLLHYVARESDTEFSHFTQDVYEASSYSLMVTAKQMSQVMRYIYEHEDSTVKDMMDSTDYDGEKLDAVQDNTFQKIGGTNQVNHAVAIVEGEQPYVITVLSNFASDETISNIASDVNEAINQ